MEACQEHSVGIYLQTFWRSSGERPEQLRQLGDNRGSLEERVFPAEETAGVGDRCHPSLSGRGEEFCLAPNAVSWGSRGK